MIEDGWQKLEFGRRQSETINQSYTLLLILSAFDPMLYALCPAP